MRLNNNNYMIIVNSITLSRIPLTILFGVFCLRSNDNILYCTIIFLIIAFTDILDGILARKYKVSSNIGAKLDVWCDFFFIIGAYLSLYLIGKMNIVLPIIIIIKFVEFLVTSYLNSKINTKQNILFFDFIGKSLSLIFYCLPITVLLLGDIFLKIQIYIIMIIILAAIASFFIRIRYFLNVNKKTLISEF